MRVTKFVASLTREETAEAAAECLNNLPDDEALHLIIEWLREKGLGEEVAMRFEEES